MIKNIFLPVLVLLIFVAFSCAQVIGVSAQTPAATSRTASYKFVNGQWFDGKRFKRRRFYSVNGVLTERKPAGAVETIDLNNGFVLPPFAEAHNHNFASGGDVTDLKNERQIADNYLRDGVFYVKIPTNSEKNAQILREKLLNRPESVDVSFSNSPLTSPDGHPIGMTLAALKQAGIKEPEATTLAVGSFVIIDNENDLQAKWAEFLAGKPDFVKTMLVYSEDFEARRANTKLFGYNGINPNLLSAIVEKAHAAGLRVSVHLESSADFHVAVNVGVDEINHLPGYYFRKGKTSTDYLISEKDAEAAAKKNIVVVTTTELTKIAYKDAAEIERVQAVQRQNLKLLQQKGVRIAVGSDTYTDTSVSEAMNLYSLKIFDNATLLRMWTQTTARTIFPNRKIGELRDGYEASFIVLDRNPLDDFAAVKNISFRFKQGARIVLPISK